MNYISKVLIKIFIICPIAIMLSYKFVPAFMPALVPWSFVLALLSDGIDDEKYGVKFKIRIVIYLLMAIITYANLYAGWQFYYKITKDIERDAIMEADDTSAVEEANKSRQPVYYDNESDCIYRYKEGDGSCFLDECYSQSTVLNIPSYVNVCEGKGENETYTEYKVTYIEQSAFYKNGYIEKVIIPDTVYRIESEAFNECHNLKEVVIGDSVESFDNRGEGLFVDMPDVTIVCNKDSAAYKYAVDNNIKVKLMGEE